MVSTTLDLASATIWREKRLLLHGALSDRNAHRKASAPYSSMISQGSMTLPLLLDIFNPFSSNTWPVDITALYGACPLYRVEIASRLKNQPRVWSIPSQIMSAGYCSRKVSPSPNG
ncbi:hypothetical protein D3C71_1802000 [compost metagenome]